MSQTKVNSLTESFSGALVAAPTANFLHWLMLQLFDQHVINENQPYFIAVSWIVFFFHSVSWKYITRRVFDVYGVQLDVIHIARSLRRRLPPMDIKFRMWCLWHIRDRSEKTQCSECEANADHLYTDGDTDPYGMCEKCASRDNTMYVCNRNGYPIGKCEQCNKKRALSTFVPVNWRDLDQDDFYDSYIHGVCHKCAKREGIFEVDIEGNVNDTRMCRCGHDIDTHQKGKGVCWHLEINHECECMRFVLETRVMCECDHAPKHHRITNSSGFKFNTILECQHKDDINEPDCRCGYYREKT